LEEVLSGVVDLRRKTRAEVSELLSSRDYNVVEEDMDFKYLTKMPMDSVTSENVIKLNREFQTKQGELEVLKITSDRQMWIQELSALTSAYSEYKQGRERLQAGAGEDAKSKKRSATKSNVVVNKKVKPLEKV
jgi:DNA topoisomerase-2